MAGKTRKIPFSVNRNDDRTLVLQVVDGFREAIRTGFYVHGDSIPSYRELSPMLGVSQIVTKTALRMLAAEGLVESRPRIGTVVRDLGMRQWHGHVVFVCPEDDIGYFQSVMGETIRTRVNRAGWLFTRATVVGDGAHGGKYDFALLDAALSRSVDLAILLYDRPAIAKRLSDCGVPYAVVSGLGKPPPGSVGMTRIDFDAAVPDFVAACEAAGIRKVVQFFLPEAMCDALPALRAAGISARAFPVKPDFAKGKFFAIEEAGRSAFAQYASSREFDPEAVCFFSSEYVARGALLEMTRRGLDAPGSIRVVTWANAGMGPTYFRPLSRMEMDPEKAGSVAADAAIAYLRKGVYPADSSIGPKWKSGETLGASAK